MLKLNITRQDILERLKRDSERISDADLGKVLDKADEIRRKFGSSGPLGRFARDAKLMLALIQDFWKGSYRQIPWYVIAAIAASLLYVLSPMDMIPDFLLLFGYIDDAFMVGACLMMIEQQLAEYELWKIEQSVESESIPQLEDYSMHSEA
jgi:uncharacterized membrane protein YkvA (DUF1232 family)